MSESASYTLPEAGEPVVVTSTDGTYVYNAAHVDEAIDHLIQWFKRPRNMEILRITIGEIQQLEDAYRDLMAAWDVNTAVGDQLDKLGARIGELRNDRTDAAYRTAIKVRVLVNSSEGTVNELLDIIELAEPTLVVQTRESYPAGIYFRWLGSFTNLTAQDLYNLLRQAKPAGVKLQAVVRNPTAGFIWGSTVNAGLANTTTSWGNEAGTIGGKWAEVW